jgi:hypothetical protein
MNPYSKVTKRVSRITCVASLLPYFTTLFYFTGSLCSNSFEFSFLFYWVIVFTKGQIQTPPYRFLARHGGYAWVQTQATLVYGNRDSRPQAVVCVHTCLRYKKSDKRSFGTQLQFCLIPHFRLIVKLRTGIKSSSSVKLKHQPLVWPSAHWLRLPRHHERCPTSGCRKI